MGVFRRRKAKAATGEGENGSRTVNKEPLDLVAEAERRAETRERLLAQLPLVSSFGLFAYVVLKVLIVSRGDPNTALAIVRSAGPVQVVAGVLIANIGLVGTSVANAASVIGTSGDLSRNERYRAWTIYGIVAVGLSFVVSWTTTVVFLINGGVHVWGYIQKRRGKAKETRNPADHDSVDAWLKEPPQDVVLRGLWNEYKQLQEQLPFRGGIYDLSVGKKRQERTADIIREYNKRVHVIRKRSRQPIDAFALAVAFTSLWPVVGSAVGDDPWFPAEDITVESETFAGYVVSMDSDWTTILVDRDREVRLVQSDDVSERQICRPEGGTGPSPQTMWEKMGIDQPSPAYPRCEQR